MLHLLIITSILGTSTAKPQQQIAFCSTVSGQQSIFLANLDGTGLKRLTKGHAEDYDPVWSPDGSTILFTRVPGHTKGEVRSDGHLWTIRADGTKLTRLTSGPVFDSGAWTRDGKRISFYRQGPKPGHYAFDLVTRKITRHPIQMWSASFSADGKRIAYIRSETEGEDDHRADIWLSTSQTRKGQRLTKFKTSFSQPQWSPNGREIAFKMELPSGPSSGDALCIMSISNRKIRVVVKGHNNSIDDPQWSPDGKRLCFLETEDTDPMTNASFRQLYVISASGTGKRRLTNHWGNDWLPQWTRDGRSILVQGERGMSNMGGVTGTSTTSTTNLIVVDASGKGERTISTGLDCYSPAISP